MSALISCVFFLAVAYSAYSTAKRQGRWSWPQFLVVVATLIAVPILVIQVMMHVRWLQDRPVAFTLIATGLIIACVCAFALALNKWWKLPAKPP